jgi:hypothetical protein
MHRNVAVDTSGGRRFVEGEVTDDILVRALCLDCGEFLSESDVRGTWRGESLEESPSLQLEDDFEDDVVPNREEVKEWQQQTGRKSFSIPRSLLHKRVSVPK